MVQMHFVVFYSATQMVFDTVAKKKEKKYIGWELELNEINVFDKMYSYSSYSYFLPENTLKN